MTKFAFVLNDLPPAYPQQDAINEKMKSLIWEVKGFAKGGDKEKPVYELCQMLRIRDCD